MWEYSDVHTWGMIDIFFLKSWSPILVIKILSIQTLPSGSDNLKRAAMKELFPAPVLPTMPTCEEIQEGLRTNNMQQTWEKPWCLKLNFKSSILNIVYTFSTMALLTFLFKYFVVMGWEAVLCIVGCLAVAMDSTH